MAEEPSKREFYHIQASPYRFQSKMYSPEKEKGSGKRTGKPVFSVEVMVYVSGAGLDIVDPFNSGNELLVAFRNYIRMKEILGYEHLGLSSDQITQWMKNAWGKEF